MPNNRSLPVPSPQPAAPSAEVLALRTSWKWAYLSHFLFTFNPVLHLEDIQLSELEDDLAFGTFEVLPTVMQRLLMSLTPHDKRMILEDWQQQLRKQSLRRAPDDNIMGTEDEPVDFASLIMSDKLDLIQALCEWQFHNPNNLRARMKDDDEYANWRMEPIAYDAKGNAYWLMGGNRLWIQYAPPRKRTKSHKRKQPATISNDRKSAKRKQPVVASSSKATAASKTKASATNPTGSRSIRETRSRGQPSGSSAQQKSRTMGIRVSSRLRGKEEEEIWQPIPEEWLKEESNDDGNERPNGSHFTEKEKGKDVEFKKGLTSLDDGSELTSLSDLTELPSETEGEEDSKEEEVDEEEESSPSTPLPDPSSSNEESWETVCATLTEWEEFPQRFEKSAHRAEKTFYKLLTNDLVPMITEVLRVDVRKKVMEEAVVHRKRSSRIAVKESVREAERAEARRKAEEEKELERHRRWEARARKEEEDRIRRENMRSARLREKGRTGSESVDVDVDVAGVGLEAEPARANGIEASAPVNFIVTPSKSGTQTPKDEPWELDCEICHRRGMNLDDGQELMCCERCNKWQHIRCHDQADFIAGRSRRNWELDDFLCSACAAVKSHYPPQGSSVQRQPQYAQTQVDYNGNGLGNISAVQLPRDPRTVERIKPPVKQTYEPSSYGNGHATYTVPQAQTQPSYPTSTPPPIHYAQRTQPPSIAAAHSSYPTSSTSQSRVPAPYNTSPNVYSSNYSGGPRPPQNLALQPQPPSSYYRSTAPMAHAQPQTGAWSQQQMQYSQLANQQSWNGTTHGSGSQPYVASNITQSPHQNGYYHPRPAPPPSNPLNPKQHYYNGGPSS
ncbi:hypothetical protein K439DRAFT_256606 [Ramaria rubella]|nr:hypothetical protein K439DRAFT_256606 [Ramaria rubella]